jgi:hypothetical protein
VPELEPGCIMPCVGNLVGEKFYVFSKVSHIKLLGTIVDRSGWTIANIQEIFIIIISWSNVSLPYSEETHL